MIPLRQVERVQKRAIQVDTEIAVCSCTSVKSYRQRVLNLIILPLSYFHIFICFLGNNTSRLQGDNM